MGDAFADDRAALATSRFASGVEEKLGYYVYVLTDPRTDRVFYVGKGTGSRCFAHLDEARKTAADSTRDYPKLATIREIEADGTSVRIELLRHGLDEDGAFAVEAAVMDLLGMTDLHNRVVGHDTAQVGRMTIADINAAYGAKPVSIDDKHAVLLIRVAREFRRGISDAELYEATRSWWKVSLTRAQQARWAFAVFGGVVRAVYAIESWESPTPEVVVDDPKRAGRWAFVGRRDAEMESTYLFRDVTAYLPMAAQNPVRYVNC